MTNTNSDFTADIRQSDKTQLGTYALLDSGNGEKLEQFGAIRLVRPSSLCIWKKHLPNDEWKKADARFDAEKGWIFKHKQFETWQLSHAGCVLELRLQTNGQVGVFPEHGGYLNELGESLEAISKISSEPIKVLNLFAYTGLASAFCAKKNAEVCHVDLSKKALSWATRNFELNNIDKNKVRLICDDALKFLQREIKRGSKYDIVVVDPPSFSRISKTQYWKLEEIIADLVRDCFSMLKPASGSLLVTCHHPGISCEMLANLILDNLSLGNHGDKQFIVSRKELGLPEKTAERILPAGSMAFCWPKA